MDIPDLEAFIQLENQNLTRICLDHLLECQRPHCVLKCGRKPAFFYFPEPGPEQLDVPDSLQPGHGLKLCLPLVSTCSTVFCRAVSAECVVSSRSWEQAWKVQCCCQTPACHPHLLDLLCENYNKNHH
ncbi:E3 12.5K [Bat mastadenovirus WIV9]|uniref:E3 12.5K n=1 Tax=Bat mastadenovirus WIV9 TaxID=1788436 RepID=A0A163HIP3_9ADEN|nr:E3 12.5K [Bat mastadenovirus WIV9]AMB43065.1 E3 12.5K [Bat mastadenovirus WIV9]